MLKLFREAKSVENIANSLWIGVSNWPKEKGEAFKRKFDNKFLMKISDVFDEISFFLGYATDFGIKTCLIDKHAMRRAIRDKFANHLNNFALQRRCKPLPLGDWVDDSLFWSPQKQKHIETEHPVDNLKNRFSLYDKSIQRQKEAFPSQCTAQLLGVLCGNCEADFIGFASYLFHDQRNHTENIIKSYRIVL
jgi:hypothetical protein